jgi:hypothetical protein
MTHLETIVRSTLSGCTPQSFRVFPDHLGPMSSLMSYPGIVRSPSCICHLGVPQFRADEVVLNVPHREVLSIWI